MNNYSKKNLKLYKTDKRTVLAIWLKKNMLKQYRFI